MRQLLLLIYLFCSVFYAKAQYDTEHWFPALYTGQAINGSACSLYLSTGETTAFDVEIYKQNTLIRTVSIKKDEPAIVRLAEGTVLNKLEENLLTAADVGISVKGEKRFFANIRISDQVGTALINSKGLAALGREFYNSQVPLAIFHGSLYFMSSIIATEDNTKVKISNYDPEVKFSNGLQAKELNIILNKGQSFIMTGPSLETANRAGFIGAKITSDKDIALVNGAFNGQYYPEASQESFNSGQIMLDQAVPLTRLGDEFIILRGFDISGDSERVFVMGTEDNTQIYLNDESNAYITLNSGEYAVIPSTKYKMQRIGMYSMNIRASKNIYTYQIASKGSPTNSSFSVGSFILVPPVNCYLPNTIDQIGFIGNGEPLFAKLNILTLKDAKVKVNGNLLGPSEGPEEVIGNEDWGNFLYFARDSHITIESDNSVAVGLFTRNQIGGYFAGFSSVPAISKSGDCLTEIKLSVDNTYDSYQWFKDGLPIPSEVTYFINPEKYGSGNYTVEVSKSTCKPLKTAPYNYTRCLDGIVSEENIGSCNIFEIIPKFDGATDPIEKIEITYHPLRGKLEIVNDKIRYTPETSFTGDSYYTDDFTYTIFGSAESGLVQTFSVRINVHFLNFDGQVEHKMCFDDLNNITFDLTKIDLGQNQGNSVKFYTESENEGSLINNPENYKTDGKIFAKINSPFGCVQFVNIQLIAMKGLDSENLEIDFCLEPNQNEIAINLSEYFPESSAEFYENEEDAKNRTNEISEIRILQKSETIFVRMQKGDCMQINSLKLNLYSQPKVNIIQNGSTVTVEAVGGTPPFLYSLDDEEFTSGNIFSGLKSGRHTIKVSASENCTPQEFTIMVNSLPNTFSPNNDGRNDIFDFSEFSGYANLRINIFNRFGVKVFSNLGNKDLLWNGKNSNGTALQTGNYWYTVEWQENETSNHIKGWILLKNR